MAKQDASLAAADEGNLPTSDPRMVLALDVGNTETRIGLFALDDVDATVPSPAAAWSLTTPSALTADEALLSLSGVFAMLDAKPSCAGAIVSCVVPALTDAWCAAAKAACSGTRPLVVGPGLKTGLPMDYRDPAEVGPDRIADVVAAKARYGAPAIIVDLGTTTNLTVLDRAGSFAGGIIAAGMRLSARMLPENAARLSMMELRAPRSVIGKSTREAMQAGVVLGEVARIDGLVDLIWEELGYRTQLVATGTDAAAIAALSRHKGIAVDTDLTLAGLALLYQANRPKKR